MLNKAILMGRITRDLELKQTPNAVSVLSFTIAVERNFARQGEERQTDFIDCVAWRQTAEFISRYFGKGRMIGIVGSVTTRTYQDKNGQNRKVTEIQVEEASFTGEPKQQGQGSAQGGYQQPPQNGGYNQQQPQPNSGYNQQSYQNGNNSNSPQNQQGNDLMINQFDDFGALTDEGVPF